jgi:hypothetical protein
LLPFGLHFAAAGQLIAVVERHLYGSLSRGRDVILFVFLRKLPVYKIFSYWDRKDVPSRELTEHRHALKLQNRCALDLRMVLTNVNNNNN